MKGRLRQGKSKGKSSRKEEIRLNMKNGAKTRDEKENPGNSLFCNRGHEGRFQELSIIPLPHKRSKCANEDEKLFHQLKYKPMVSFENIWKETSWQIEVTMLIQDISLYLGHPSRGHSYCL
jgi:hypothetical protein